MATYKISNASLRECAKKQIAYVFLKLFHIPISTTIQIQIPSFIGQSKRLIQSFCCRILEGYKPPYHIKKYLRSVISMSFTAQPSVGDILCNNIQFGKKWTLHDHEHEYKNLCKCSELSQRFGIPLQPHDHIQINAMDLPRTSPLYGLLVVI